MAQRDRAGGDPDDWLGDAIWSCRYHMERLDAELAGLDRHEAAAWHPRRLLGELETRARG